MPAGLEDVSKYPDIFDKLAEGGPTFTPWSREELKKLAGENLIRVFKEVGRVRDSLKSEKPIDDPIPYNDILNQNPQVAGCRTDINRYQPANTKSIADVYSPAKIGKVAPKLDLTPPEDL